MWELDNKKCWAPKNWRFWSVVLEKTLESPLESKEIKSVNPKGICPEYSLKELMLRVKLQYFGHLMRRADSFEKTLMLERLKAGGEGRGWDDWMASLIQWTWVWVNSRSCWWTGRPGVLQSMGLQRVGQTERLNWTDWCAVKQASWQNITASHEK